VPPWLFVVIALCLVAVTAALVLAILALKRVAVRTERVLAIVELDLHPTIARAQALVDELQGLSRDVRVEVERVGALTRRGAGRGARWAPRRAGRAPDLAQSSAQLLGGLAGFARAGRLMGVAVGVKTGLDVFLRRLRRA
jgi:hypothetical protein